VSRHPFAFQPLQTHSKMETMTKTISKMSMTPHSSATACFDGLECGLEITLPPQQTVSMPNMPLSVDTDIFSVSTQILTKIQESIGKKWTEIKDQEPKDMSSDFGEDPMDRGCIDTVTTMLRHSNSLADKTKPLDDEMQSMTVLDLIDEEVTSKISEMNMNVVEYTDSATKLIMKATDKKKRERRHKSRGKKRKRTRTDQAINCRESCPSVAITPHSVNPALEISFTDHRSLNLKAKRESVSTTGSMTKSMTKSTMTEDSRASIEMKGDVIKDQYSEDEDEDEFVKECIDDIIREMPPPPNTSHMEHYLFPDRHWEEIADFMEEEEALKMIEEDICDEIKKCLEHSAEAMDSTLHQCNSDEKGDDIEDENAAEMVPTSPVISGQQQQHPMMHHPVISGYGVQQHHPMNNGYAQQWIPQRHSPSMMVVFGRMHIADLMTYELTMQEIIDLNLFPKFIGDAKGSQYLIRLVEGVGADEPAMHSLSKFLLFEPIHFVDDVVETRFGNKFIQSLFQKQMVRFHNALLKKWIYPFSLRLSGNKFGCRVIQRVINSAAVLMDHKVELVNNLRHQITMNDVGREALRKLIVSINGNHVLRAVLTLGLPSDSIDFIRIELDKEIVPYSSDVSACRVVQAYISSYGDRLNISPLLVNNHHIDLAQREYGNHVIQCILKQNAWYSSQPRFVQFRAQFLRDVFTRRNLLRLSRGKHGSHVLESCIRTADNEQIELLAKLCVSGRAILLKKMMWDQFGNYVLRTLFDRCSNAMKKVMADAVYNNVSEVDWMSHSELQRYSEFIYKVYWFRQKQWEQSGKYGILRMDGILI